MKQFVYVMRSDSGLVKIGIAGHPETRRAILQATSGHPLVIVETFGPFNHAHAVETQSHASLKAHRREGEWFACTEEDAVAAVRSALESFSDIEDRVPSEAAERMTSEAIARMTDPLARMNAMAKLLMALLESKTDECIALTNEFVEATELMDFYANQAKNMAEIARVALDKVQRLEGELAAARQTLPN